MSLRMGPAPTIVNQRCTRNPQRGAPITTGANGLQILASCVPGQDISAILAGRPAGIRDPHSSTTVRRLKAPAAARRCAPRRYHCSPAGLPCRTPSVRRSSAGTSQSSSVLSASILYCSAIRSRARCACRRCLPASGVAGQSYSQFSRSLNCHGTLFLAPWPLIWVNDPRWAHL
jgi:hypothetical protein